MRLFKCVKSFLADRTAARYDWLLASSYRPSVCLSVTLCIVALRAGVAYRAKVMPACS